MPDDQAQPIVCASYTHARRHPMVLGTIADWSFPFQVTITQIGVFLVGLVAVNQTWRFWAPLLAPVVATIVGVGLPVLVAWFARRVRIEGRSPLRAALGWIQLWSAPAAGVIGGRPARPGRPSDLSQHRIIVAGDDRIGVVGEDR
jgi:hypothetical protein